MAYGFRSGWFGESLRHSMAARKGHDKRRMVVGDRVIYFDGRNNKISRNIPKSQFMRGIKLQEENRVRDAKVNLLKRGIGYAVPPAGKAIDAAETVKDVYTIATKGKKRGYYG